MSRPRTRTEAACLQSAIADLHKPTRALDDLFATIWANPPAPAPVKPRA